MIRKHFRQLCMIRPLTDHLARCLSGGSEFFSGSGNVRLDQEEDTGIAVVTLDNPGKKNALSGTMMLQLESIVQRLEQWSSGKAVIVNGHGGDFCTGGDLDFVRKILTREDGYKMCSLMQGTLTRFKNLPLVSVAVIEGMAVGGGAELATACDFRLMTPSAKIGFVQLKMGVVTGFGGGTRLTQMLGRSQALRILCSGRVLKAEECREVGLADHILSGDEDCVEETKEWIQVNFPHDNTLTQKVKQTVVWASELDTQSALEKERDIFSATWSGPLQLEALSNNIKHK